MKKAKYSYNGYTIDYTLISKEEVYSKDMDTLFAASVVAFIRDNKIADFSNVVIINSIKNDANSNVFDDNHIRVAFQAFLYYELNDAGTTNIILTELDMYDYGASVFVDLIVEYMMLGFVSANDAFPSEDRVAFVLPSSSAKSFIKKVVETAVEKL